MTRPRLTPPKKRTRFRVPLIAGLLLRVRVMLDLLRLPVCFINHIFAAQIIGLNELAKMQVELSQKAICRLLLRSVQEAANGIGIKVLPQFTNENPVVLEIELPGDGLPRLEFRESDWELMREALKRHDLESEARDAKT